MAEHRIDVIGMNHAGDELSIQRFTVDITPNGHSWDATVLHVDALKTLHGAAIETSRIYTAAPVHRPPEWVKWFLAEWLTSSEAKNLIGQTMAHHDEFEEQRREADREARAVARSYARSAL